MGSGVVFNHFERESIEFLFACSNQIIRQKLSQRRSNKHSGVLLTVKYFTVCCFQSSYRKYFRCLSIMLTSSFQLWRLCIPVAGSLMVEVAEMLVKLRSSSPFSHALSDSDCSFCSTRRRWSDSCSSNVLRICLAFSSASRFCFS